MVGVGTVVCAGVTAWIQEPDRLRSIWATGRIYPPNEHAEIEWAGIVPAPSRIADALGLAPGTYVMHRHRVTYRDDVPISPQPDFRTQVEALREMFPRHKFVILNERNIQMTRQDWPDHNFVKWWKHS